ncbi:MAG: aminotransferase class I/II-fold pyridoxal phosphate-dependent enzyme [Acidobacteriota bacterium]
MKAIVLAAGQGARLRPLTDRAHKSLLPVAGSTILGRIMKGLHDLGIAEVIVVTGYRAGDVRRYLEEHDPGLPVRFVHNARYKETNNIVSLAMALDSMEIDSDVVLVECDVLFDPAVLARLASPERGNIALLDRYRPGMDGTVVSVEAGLVTHVFPAHLQTEDFDYSGKFKTLNLYRFDRDFCRKRLQPLLSCYANVIDSGCYYELVLGMLINMQREVVRAEIVDGSQWAEVDDPNDLAAARFIFEPASRAQILDRAKGGHWNFPLLDFNFIRNMYFPTDAMMAAMRRALPSLVHSYGSAQCVLNEKLSYVLQCAPERVQCLNGAAQIYPQLQSLLRPRRVLIPTPTFGEYERWLGAGADFYTDAVGIDQQALAARAGEYDLVVLVNPNNPTGSVLPTSWLHTLAAAHPSTTFLVDESFADFAAQPSLRDHLDRSALPNVLIIASLSKSLGVPGLRLGYAYSCDTDLIARIGAGIPIWNLGSPAEFLLETVLKFKSELTASFPRTAADRCDFLRALELVPRIRKVYPSAGNFLLFRLDGDQPGHARWLTENLLARHSIYLKDVSSRFPTPGSYLRAAVRTPAENHRLVDALTMCLAEMPL